MNEGLLRVTMFRRGILNLRYMIWLPELPRTKAGLSHIFLTPWVGRSHLTTSSAYAWLPPTTKSSKKLQQMSLFRGWWHSLYCCPSSGRECLSSGTSFSASLATTLVEEWGKRLKILSKWYWPDDVCPNWLLYTFNFTTRAVYWISGQEAAPSIRPHFISCWRRFQLWSYPEKLNWKSLQSVFKKYLPPAVTLKGWILNWCNVM